MVSTTCDYAFRLLKERAGNIFGAQIVPVLLLIVLLATTVPMMSKMMAAAAVSAAVKSSAANATGVGGGAIVTGNVVAIGLFVFAAAFVLSLVSMLAGVAAASGLSFGSALGVGLRGIPFVVVQTLKVSWLPLAVMVAGSVLAIAMPLSLLLTGLATIVLYVRVLGKVTLVVGSVASGNMTTSVDAVNVATDGQEWTASGVAVIGALLGGAIAMIPVVGTVIQMVWMGAFSYAMWAAFEEDNQSGPSGEYNNMLPEQQSLVSQEVERRAVGSDSQVPAHSPSFVAGPSWYALVSPTEPAGGWIQLAHPAQVGVHVQWVAGVAPLIQLADQAGVWRTPQEQPGQSGQVVWMELPAGYTWIALTSSEDQQQIWCSTQVPASALMVTPSTTGAA